MGAGRASPRARGPGRGEVAGTSRKGIPRGSRRFSPGRRTPTSPPRSSTPDFGTAADYDALAKAGVSAEGTGSPWSAAQGLCRGMKARIAAARGLAGLLLYPEPKDQGFAKPAYPEGPNTPPNAIERGSLLAYFLYPGDPAGARRAGMRDASAGSGDRRLAGRGAGPSLAAMTGDAVPEEWKGWLKAPYVLAEERGRSFGSWSRAASRRGRSRTSSPSFPGRTTARSRVLVGSHFDAWVNGAVDPSSGTAAVLEAAEALAQLRGSWWRPRADRPLRVLGWRGARHLRLHAMGRADEPRVVRRARGLRQRRLRGSRRRLRRQRDAGPPGSARRGAGARRRPGDREAPSAETKGTYRLPGFSSDAGPFLGLSGTPVAEIGFGRSYPVYHTRFDSIDWVRRFGDPGFARAALFARILALYVGRLASDP